jgi:hypothetical protein
MAARPAFLDDLEHAARRASVAEDALRREIAARVKALETERMVAFRRLNLMAAIVEAVAAAPDAATAVGDAAAVLRDRLGWTDDSAVRERVVEAFGAVARAVATSLEEADREPTPALDVLAALAEFERWYAAGHPTAFWDLFDTYMPETPRVDF